MNPVLFSRQLERYGPASALENGEISIEQARQYCRDLANRRYENFTVASWLLPRRLRQAFYNVYAYCRWADDLADETNDPAQSLELLDWWEGELDECYAGRTRHPVFTALQQTIDEFAISRQPFADLLIAFRRDQRQTRYETFDELLEYCRYSANPVGRILLHLARRADEESVRRSDAICTGLQLANFWQDVARDYQRGRIYLPQETCRRFGYDQAMFEKHQFNEPFRKMMKQEVDRADGFFQVGKALPSRMPADLRVDIELFLRGGQSVLAAIRRIGYDVWSRRPTLGKAAKLRLLAGAVWTHHFRAT